MHEPRAVAVCRARERLGLAGRGVLDDRRRGRLDPHVLLRRRGGRARRALRGQRGESRLLGRQLRSTLVVERQEG